ncbi:MAG: class I SAM-dependent rRNA methyltransferase [Acidobacteriota bacterium]|nr:class I SAM-dependent rRNA methyltransferase [Acidobacteriota bacterium]
MTPGHTPPFVVVSARGVQRVRGGHPWIYRSDVADVQAEAGDIVQVLGPHERPIGYAFYSDRSQITLRMVSRGEARPDTALWRGRLEAALAFREALRLDATAYRLVHAEGDLLPSLVVDRYGDCLVVQALSQATDRLLPALVTMLVELIGPRGILARNDPRARLLEGLTQDVAVVYGEVPDTLTVTEGGVEYAVDPWRGQKTGLFLDQRENREAAARYAGGRLLDCFSYNGGFALHLAPHCQQVTAIDVSEEAVGRITRNAARNRLGHVTAYAANVFDELRRLEHDGDRFDTIVLDPPAFAKNKAAVPKALAGYKEINLRALKLLTPGGCLVTCSCSHHVDEAMFLRVVHEAALDAACEVTLVEKRMQGRDHPVLLGVPETYYLKCLILRKVG